MSFELNKIIILEKITDCEMRCRRHYFFAENSYTLIRNRDVKRHVEYKLNCCHCH